jgi:uncharacterized protein
VDGNAPENGVRFNNLEVKGLSLAPGESVWVRWFDVNNRGPDHGIGLDDVRMKLD